MIMTGNESAAPPGWQLVPQEPTQAIIEGIGRALIDYENVKWDDAYVQKDTGGIRTSAVHMADSVWRAALAAAPQPPRAEPAGRSDDPSVGAWRVGNHYRIHVYEDQRPVATFHAEEDARRCVQAVNAKRGDDPPAVAVEAGVEVLSGYNSDFTMPEEAVVEIYHAMRASGDPSVGASCPDCSVLANIILDLRTIIDTLTRELERKTGALKPFAKESIGYDAAEKAGFIIPDEYEIGGGLTVGDLRRAHAAHRGLETSISAAIGSVRWVDPPDGGDVSLAEQVTRMRAELERKTEALTQAAGYITNLYNNREIDGHSGGIILADLHAALSPPAITDTQGRDDPSAGAVSALELANAISRGFVRALPAQSAVQDHVTLHIMGEISPLIGGLTRERDELRRKLVFYEQASGYDEAGEALRRS